jgi:hypothetical protein
MKRWDFNSMLEIGKKLFARIHRQKKHANPNHDVHFMAREIDTWLPKGIQAIMNGTYDPQCLKRYYFPDEVVDQLHLSDRVFQHILLQQLKPTFKHVMNPNCYHLDGPTGVKYATQRIKQILEEEKPKYFLRVDIRSYYASIPKFKLLRDIKKYYHDPKVIKMLDNIINNPIDTPRGTRNPSHGITLRGPLSQFFSALYLKPLDDSLSSMNIHYLRFQDDLIAFCKTKRQLNRCRRRMMEVLQERQLKLSRKKSRMGSIESGFHFLGVDYLPTQAKGNTTATHANDDVIEHQYDNYLTMLGGVRQFLIINSMRLCKLSPMREHFERRARMLNKWSLMESLSERSDVIYSAGLRGGKTLQVPGNTRNCYSNLLRFVGTS